MTDADKKNEWQKPNKELGGYWIYKEFNGEILRRKPTAQELIEAEKNKKYDRCRKD